MIELDKTARETVQFVYDTLNGMDDLAKNGQASNKNEKFVMEHIDRLIKKYGSMGECYLEELYDFLLGMACKENENISQKDVTIINDFLNRTDNRDIMQIRVQNKNISWERVWQKVPDIFKVWFEMLNCVPEIKNDQDTLESYEMMLKIMFLHPAQEYLKKKNYQDKDIDQFLYKYENFLIKYKDAHQNDFEKGSNILLKKETGSEKIIEKKEEKVEEMQKRSKENVNDEEVIDFLIQRLLS